MATKEAVSPADVAREAIRVEAESRGYAMIETRWWSETAVQCGKDAIPVSVNASWTGEGMHLRQNGKVSVSVGEYGDQYSATFKEIGESQAKRILDRVEEKAVNAKAKREKKEAAKQQREIDESARESAMVAVDGFTDGTAFIGEYGEHAVSVCAGEMKRHQILFETDDDEVLSRVLVAIEGVLGKG